DSTADGEYDVPRRGTVGHAGGLPQAAAVVRRGGGPAHAEAGGVVCGRVVGVVARDLQLLAEAALRLLVDVVQGEQAGLELAGLGAHDLYEVVPRAGRDLGGDGRREVGEVDVVDDDGDAVRRAPLAGVLVEPGVVRGHDVAPLQDPQAPAALRAQQRRPDGRCRRGGAGVLEERPAGDATLERVEPKQRAHTSSHPFRTERSPTGRGAQRETSPGRDAGRYLLTAGAGRAGR